MEKQQLGLTQCIKNVKIFLNLFGFILDPNDNILHDDKIVGKIDVKEDKIKMSACYHDFHLNASYQIPVIKNYKTDPDYDYKECDSKFVFNATNDNIKYSGNIIMSDFSDEYGRGCTLEPLVYIHLPHGEFIKLEMNRNKNTFGLESISDGRRELIEVNPFDKVAGYIKHTTEDGDYEHFVGVCSTGTDSNEMFIRLFERENDRALHNQLISKCGEDYTGASIIQKGLLMNIIDSDMFNQINSLREKMKIGDDSLFDNLISTSYDRFSKEEVKALLGVDRKTFYYQDGEKKLNDSYFGAQEERPKVFEKTDKRIRNEV